MIFWSVSAAAHLETEEGVLWITLFTNWASGLKYYFFCFNNNKKLCPFFPPAFRLSEWWTHSLKQRVLKIALRKYNHFLKYIYKGKLSLETLKLIHNNKYCHVAIGYPTSTWIESQGGGLIAIWTGFELSESEVFFQALEFLLPLLPATEAFSLLIP